VSSKPAASSSRREVLVEVIGLWLVTMLLIRGLKVAVDLGAPKLILAGVPLLFMYMPVAMCRWRGVDSWGYPLAIPSFRDWPTWRRALKANGVLIAIMVIPWIGLYHAWQTSLLPSTVMALNPWLGELTRVFAEWGWLGPRATLTLPIPHFEFRGVWPDSIVLLIAYHLFFVAIPEEMFYRGYLQSRLEEHFRPGTRAFGTVVGRALIFTSLLFAFGHSIVELQWWHFAIFVPSLVFGWLRNRTGDIMAGAFFHAWCNVLAVTLDTLYGVVLPASATGG
jgi:membrane protease YdiL (CAAX protease family)